jgi:hypothetical protein
MRAAVVPPKSAPRLARETLRKAGKGLKSTQKRRCGLAILIAMVTVG